jgi:hypothetical protein
MTLIYYHSLGQNLLFSLDFGAGVARGMNVRENESVIMKLIPPIAWVSLNTRVLLFSLEMHIIIFHFRHFILLLPPPTGDWP